MGARVRDAFRESLPEECTGGRLGGRLGAIHEHDTNTRMGAGVRVARGRVRRS
jgi:hypothetical protein